MRHAALIFPGGLSGIALSLLRVSVVLFLVTAAAEFPGLSSYAAAALYTLAVVVVVGLWTRVAAAAAALLAFGLFVRTHGASAVLAHVFDSIGLVVLGPGLFSLDALRFGRRVFRVGAGADN